MNARTNHPHALVTGATGFIGSSLVENLLGNGYRVTGLARKPGGFLDDGIMQHPAFTFLSADLTEAGTLVTPEPAETVFHTAAYQPGHAERNFENFYRGNVGTTAGAIDLARRCGARLFVHCSTIAVFGEQPAGGPLTESDRPVPASDYGISKFVAEQLVRRSLQDSPCQSVIVRFPSLFGRRHLGGIVHTYYHLAATGEPIEVFSRGQRFRNLLHAGDAVQLLARIPACSNTLAQHQVLHYGSADSMRLIEVAERIKHLTKSHSDIRPVAVDAPLDWDTWIDTSTAQRLLHVTPRTIDEGLNLYVKEMENGL